MDIIVLSAIALTSAANSAIPGPCVAMTIGRSARDGLSAGAQVSLGVLLANLILCSIALAVMHGLLALSPVAYSAMKWLGILALLILAFRMLQGSGSDQDTCKRSDRRDLYDLSAGLTVGLSSPFNLIFLLALLPQIVPEDDLSATGVLLITLAVLAGAAISLAGAALVGVLSGGVANGAGRLIERLGALSMIVFAGLATTAPIA